MNIHLLTLFPQVCTPYLDASILGRAQEKGLLQISVHDIRDHAHNRHRTTDDAPYGGGGGMIMKPDPVFAAVESISLTNQKSSAIILLSPQGRIFNQDVALELAGLSDLILISGKYEGFDERIRKYLATDEISVGDYVMTGGELPALVIIDTVTRLMPGVLGDEGATQNDSHSDRGLLEHPHYTRPVNFRGWEVPNVLLSGDHAKVNLWRKKWSLFRTWSRRPDLLTESNLTQQEKDWLDEFKQGSFKE